MVAKRIKNTKKKQKRAGFSPFLRGAIWGLYFLAGWSEAEIADEVPKLDGTPPTQQAVSSVVVQAEKNGGYLWDGEDGRSVSETVGRPRATTAKLDKEILKLVKKHRGRVLVTPKYIKKMIPAARKVCLRTLRRRLGEAGLAWLRRRRKTLVSKEHREARVQWAHWVLQRTCSTISRWAYSDGTVFYLARTANEKLSKARAALGPFVWRQANGCDALYEECVGPSVYWKAQGLPVRIWGLLVAGVLYVYVLPEKEVMNRWWYAWLVTTYFPRWIAKSLRGQVAGTFLVQDHERCLWSAEPREAMQEQGLVLLENYPKCSADLNPIEEAWRELRARLASTEPADMEDRATFLVRLRQAVAWVNVNRANRLQWLCKSQKERARDVLRAKPPGARTKW
jgi:transposase